MKTNKRKLNIIIYVATILSALVFLYIGNKFASEGMVIKYHDDEFPTTEAKVIRILDSTEENFSEWMISTTITFEASITNSVGKNEIIIVTQNLRNDFDAIEREVSEGDRILIVSNNDEWHFAGHVMINKIIILGAVFIVLLLLLGGFKGLNAVLALGFTCAAIFAVFIPSILSDKNIYIAAIIVCTYSIIFSLLIINGVNKKSFAAIVGCFGGVIAASALTLFMSTALGLTGMVDSESVFLLHLPTANPIDLRAIIFAGIIIGAVGAIMDVAVSISSALWELKIQAPNLTFGNIFNSGINIGKDIMGSMTNTLVLAYIGGSLSTILLLIVYAESFTELLNRELVIVEFLQALIGSLGILLTMPLTALICAVLYSKKPGEVDGYSNE